MSLLLQHTPGQAASFGSPKDISDITAIENEMASETDIDKVMPHFAPDAVLIDMAAPGWYEGQAQIRAAITPQLATLQSIKFRMEEISVASDGTFACAAMQIHFDATRQDSTLMPLSLRQVDAFKRIDGQWRIIQQHFSLPVDEHSSDADFNGEIHSRGAVAWTKKSAPGPRVPPEQAKKEISAWLTASETPRNIDEMRSFYGPGDDFIIFDWWSSREVRGAAELHSYYGPQFNGVRDLQIKIPVAHVDSDGSFGVEVSQQQLQMNMQDGTSRVIAFRQSDCVRRVGGRWYSFFEMGSFPIDMKTGKAIMTTSAAF
ncbi:MAG TPA: nuclear transport factor 2 family protein [Steroidobacteraceae bacterium]|nr:nuclear transport factor 2 family protein [Steroidobacteraceae bacterium]